MKNPRKLPRRWTAEKILRKIRKLRDASAKHAQRFHPDLYGAALRHFSAWRSAVEAAGFEYEQIAKRKLRGFWTREKVVSEIAKLSEKNSNHVKAHRRDLYSAALRLFGTWKAAVEAAGFNYSNVRKDWVPSDSSLYRFQKKKK